MAQSKEIQPQWEGPNSFDICFRMIFSQYEQNLIYGRENGHKVLPPTNFEIFFNYASYLKSCFQSSDTKFMMLEIKYLFLLVVDQTFPKMLHCFIILFLRL